MITLIEKIPISLGQIYHNFLKLEDDVILNTTFVSPHVYNDLTNCDNNVNFITDNLSPIKTNCRIPPLQDIPASKSYRLPNNLNIILPKDRRNKKRILDNNRDITPFSSYYQQ